ncbi:MULTISPECIES: efflux RND transporter periplasmic adaptor subunit [Bradyrhizobium]|uniref:efflux RND transporter periplasmic adaptor subunit n=1 Tax=Bradyrhizobium TaxID=374 RepID=UPI000428E4CD|nr:MULTISPECIES: efflux RND transporter periplasmic adaptor subunit [Bradyrhizobium]KQT10537.1 hemolysin secretion protein D [Bradyrhizobium sp. Leaf396]
MKRSSLHRRTLALLAVIVPLLALFVYVALRSGPLAPVQVTVVPVESRPITPALFGVGTVEARFTYKIGPTAAGRIKRVDVNAGDRVHAGQLLGEMDPVDLDDRIMAQEAAIKRAEASVSAAEAQVQDALARQNYAEAQASRYERLWQTQVVSEAAIEGKRQDRQTTEAVLMAAKSNLDAYRHELLRTRNDREGLIQQRASLRLLAPVDGLVAVRHADPGTTLIAGQPVIEVIDPRQLWINVRFDQSGAAGLDADLPARIALRSRGNQLAGRVLRVEPVADAVTEETLAKIVFDTIPDPLPPIGELAEVTVALRPLPATPVIPNAAIQRVDGKPGVWRMINGNPRFTSVRFGAADLDGNIQVLEGLNDGDQVVAYSERMLSAQSRAHVVENIVGPSR